MAKLVYRDNYDSSARKHEEWMKSQNIKLCIQNGKLHLEGSDVGDNEGFFFDMKKALIPDYREVISNPEDLAKLKANFNEIKSCLQERSGNHPVAIKLIDTCEVFADNGQLSDYIDCLSLETGSVWSIDWSGQYL